MSTNYYMLTKNKKFADTFFRKNMNYTEAGMYLKRKSISEKDLQDGCRYLGNINKLMIP